MVFISLAANADYPNLSVNNISGKFYEDKGTAFAQLANFEFQQVSLTQKNTKLDFDRPDKNLVLQNENTKIQLKVDFSFLNMLEFFEFNGVNIQSDLKRFNIDAPFFTVGIGKTGEYTLKNIEIESDISKEPNVNQDIDILLGFLIKGEINIKSIFLGILDRKAFLKQILAENPGSEKLIEKTFDKNAFLPLTIRNLRLLVKTSTFSGSAFLDSWLNATVYYGGKIEYQKEEKLLTVSLLKARLGYFSIRSLLLRTIASLGIDSIEVRGSDIIIDLGKTFERDPESSDKF